MHRKIAAIDTLKVTEGKKENKYGRTRHSQFLTPINIINIYVDLKSWTSLNKIDQKWNKILSEVVKIEARAEAIILLGDMNKICLAHQQHLIMVGNLLRRFLKDANYILINTI